MFTHCCAMNLQEFPMSSILDHLEAVALKKSRRATPGTLSVYDLVTYITDTREEVDAVRFGQAPPPPTTDDDGVARSPARSRPRKAKSDGTTPQSKSKTIPAPPGVVPIRIPPEFALLGKKK